MQMCRCFLNTKSDLGKGETSDSLMNEKLFTKEFFKQSKKSSHVHTTLKANYVRYSY